MVAIQESPCGCGSGWSLFAIWPLTSDGTVYPLLNRLRDAGLVTSEWRAEEGERARRYYSITAAGRKSLAEFRTGWAQFAATVGNVLSPDSASVGKAGKGREQ